MIWQIMGCGVGMSPQTDSGEGGCDRLYRNFISEALNSIIHQPRSIVKPPHTSIEEPPVHPPPLLPNLNRLHSHRQTPPLNLDQRLEKVRSCLAELKGSLFPSRA